MGAGFVRFAALVALACGLVPRPATALPGRDAFDAACRDAGCPPAVLWAVVAARTGGGDVPAWRPEVGPAGLVPGGFPSLEWAAALAGETPDRVASDPAANLRAAAALLTAQRGAQPADLDDAAAWVRAAAVFAGSDDPAAIRAFLADVVGTLQSGGQRPGVATGPRYAALPVPFEDALAPWQAPVLALDYTGATWVPACAQNYAAGREGATIQYVIVHVMDGTYGGSIGWFQNCTSHVSAHYLVSNQGAVTQMVAEADTAWQAGNHTYNIEGIGVEHEGYVPSPCDASVANPDFTDAMYQASARLVADICDRNGIPKDRQHIIGHREVPGCPDGSGGGANCHTDPGCQWDWNRYMALVNGGVTPPPTGTLRGIIFEGTVKTGNPTISGATVTLDNGWTTKSSTAGAYIFYNVPVGQVSITATAAGYAPDTIVRPVVAGIENWGSVALQKCVANDHTACCGDAVCPVDSCGVQGTKTADCPNGCSGGACLQCTPSCLGRECGDNGCGGQCGTCVTGRACQAGKCACIPQDHQGCCGQAVCWFDGCGTQGQKVTDCPNGCSGGKCQGCKAQCTGRACGDDGCGGSCGSCANGSVCQQGMCVLPAGGDEGGATVPDTAATDAPADAPAEGAVTDSADADGAATDGRVADAIANDVPNGEAPWWTADSTGTEPSTGSGCTQAPARSPLPFVALVAAALLAARVRRTRPTSRTG